jgi:hypothetical protein
MSLSRAPTNQDALKEVSIQIQQHFFAHIFAQGMPIPPMVEPSRLKALHDLGFMSIRSEKLSKQKVPISLPKKTKNPVFL